MLTLPLNIALTPRFANLSGVMTIPKITPNLLRVGEML